MKVTFQHMFPTINVKTVKLSDCRRVVLFHFNKEEGVVEMRHYAVRATPVGISRSVKKIIQLKVPNLGDLEVKLLRIVHTYTYTYVRTQNEWYIRIYTVRPHEVPGLYMKYARKYFKIHSKLCRRCMYTDRYSRYTSKLSCCFSSALSTNVTRM